MRDIATDKKPIRASMLPYLFACPKMFYERFGADGSIDDVAANTGSMVHAGIETYHKSNGKLAVAVKAIEAAKVKYPSGDVDEATVLLRKYVEREKSNPRGQTLTGYNEFQGAVKIPCSPLDKTGQEIVITGTVDQLREKMPPTKFRPYTHCGVVDHKSGRRYGADMLEYYAPQLAVYMLIASEMLGDEKIGCYITRLQDLKRCDLPFFWEFEFNVADCLKILTPVQTRIAEIRAGLHSATPGKHCEYCAVKPYPNCVTGYPVDTLVRDAGPKAKTLPLTTAELFGRK